MFAPMSRNDFRPTPLCSSSLSRRVTIASTGQRLRIRLIPLVLLLEVTLRDMDQSRFVRANYKLKIFSLECAAIEARLGKLSQVCGGLGILTNVMSRAFLFPTTAPPRQRNGFCSRMARCAGVKKNDGGAVCIRFIVFWPMLGLRCRLQEGSMAGGRT